MWSDCRQLNCCRYLAPESMRRSLYPLFLLFSCIALPVWGDPGASHELHVSQFRSPVLEGGQRPSGQPERVLAEPRRPPQFRLPEHTYTSMDVDSGALVSGTTKVGRLSPEERRALRRQINEAGSDLYTQGQ